MTTKSTTPASLTWSGVTARRMARHALTEPAPDLSPADIAGVLCGAHAQVLSAAELSIGRRIAGATRADVQRALWEDRTLVKSFGPRGTVHLLPTADLPMWTGALSALPSSVPAHPDPVRFTPEQAEQVMAAIGDALADTELTIDELTEAIVDRTGPWAGEQTMEAFQDRWPRWRQLTSTAAHRGVRAARAGAVGRRVGQFAVRHVVPVRVGPPARRAVDRRVQRVVLRDVGIGRHLDVAAGEAGGQVEISGQRDRVVLKSDAPDGGRSPPRGRARTRAAPAPSPPMSRAPPACRRAGAPASPRL